MLQVAEGFYAIGHYLVAGFPPEVADEVDAAGVVFEAGVVEALRCR